MYPIHPVPKPYAWGSYDRLQTMFSSCLPQESVGPLAEMWFSGHGQWPSVVDMTGTNGVPVTDVIRNDPEHMVGSRSSEQFGPVMPYLLKVISARIPLSLQVHPVDFEARAGYNAENAAGIPIDSPLRSFKDPVAKSEMVVALEPFNASVGFASIPFMIRNLKLVNHPVAERMLDALSPRFSLQRHEPEGFDEADAMMPISAVVWSSSRKQIFRAFHTAITAQDTTGLIGALRNASAMATHPRSRLAFEHTLIAAGAFDNDASILSLLMMNPVSLDEGESVFIPAGIPHAYIHGTAAEIMTNSDNVLRAGMTSKHKDIANLLHTVNCRSAAPIDPAATNLVTLMMRDVVIYKPQIDAFMLAYGHVDSKHQQWPMVSRLIRRYGKLAEQIGTGPLNPIEQGPRVLLCTEGYVHCRTSTDDRVLECGESVFVPASEGWLTVDAAGDAGSDAADGRYEDANGSTGTETVDNDEFIRTSIAHNAVQSSGSFIVASTQL